MFNNTLTIVISHYCIFTEALPRPIHRGFRLLSPLLRLRFLTQRSEFAASTFGKDEVLPRANGPIVSGSTEKTLVFGVIFILILYTLHLNTTHFSLQHNFYLNTLDYEFWSNFHPNTIDYGFWSNFNPITVHFGFLPNFHPNTNTFWFSV